MASPDSFSAEGFIAAPAQAIFDVLAQMSGVATGIAT